MMCDFCSLPHPRWTFHAKASDHAVFGIPGLGGISDDGLWAACDTCADLIQRNERDKLARRSLVRLLYKLPLDGERLKRVRLLIETQHTLFFTHKQDNGVRDLAGALEDTHGAN